MDELADRFPPPLGGALCLDFANTLEAGLRDHLGNYRQLVEWSVDIGSIGPDLGRRLLGLARRQPAVPVFVEAIRLRKAIRAVFGAIAAGREPPATELTVLRDAHAAACAVRRLVSVAGTLDWQWPDRPLDLHRPLWPIAVSAVDLATSTRAARVRRCAGRGCEWLFLDTTKNGSRRWCLMRYCGNVGKSRRQAATRRAARRARATNGRAGQNRRSVS